MATLIFANDYSKESSIRLKIEELSKKDRLKAAIKRAGFFLVLMFCSIPIPLLHLFMVPISFILSIVMSIKAYQVRHLVTLEEDFKCLSCDVILRRSHKTNEDLRIKCQNCGSNYLISNKA